MHAGVRSRVLQRRPWRKCGRWCLHRCLALPRARAALLRMLPSKPRMAPRGLQQTQGLLLPWKTHRHTHAHYMTEPMLMPILILMRMCKALP